MFVPPSPDLCRWLRGSVSEWVSATLNERLGPIQLERVEGLVQVKGRSYTEMDEDSRGLAAATLAFLGYLSHDPELFKPPRPRRDKGEPPLSKEARAARKRTIAEEREKIARAWSESFQAWLAADSDRRARFTEAYNRTFRGRVGLDLQTGLVRPQQLQLRLRGVVPRGRARGR